MFQSKQHIIFDFDGTIWNSFHLAVKTSNYFATRFGYHTIDPKDISILKGMSAFEIVSYLGIARWKLPLVARLGRRYMMKYAKQIPLYDGIGDCIKMLKESNKTLYIVSSSLPESIVTCLKHTWFIKYFTSIKWSAKIRGKSSMITQLMKQQHIKPQDAVYIGDEVRDVVACHPLELDVISVTRWFNNKSLLQEHNQVTVDKPQQLLDLLLT